MLKDWREPCFFRSFRKNLVISKPDIFLKFMDNLRNSLLLIILLSGTTLKAQDLSDLKDTKPVTFHGSVGAKMSLYGADGIQSRQDPFNYGFDVNATVSLYGIDMPFSFTWFNRNKSYSQPFNQYGLSPKYKWITAHFGYRSVSFSDFTLSGHIFLGAGVEMTPGKWRIGALYGKFNQNSDYDPYKAKVIPQLTRKGWAIKIGYGTEKSFLDCSLLKIADNDKKYQPSVDPDMPTPEQNFAVGLHGKATIIKNLTLEAEGAMSVLTNNSLSDAMKDKKDNWFSLASSFININQTSQHFSAFRSDLKWKINKSLTSGLEYKRIDPGYQSMGAYFFNTDLENININQSVLMLKNKMNLRGSLGLQHDNLDNSKKFTSRRTVGSVNMSYQISQKFGIDANYNNFTTNQKAGTMAIIDSLKLFQVNRSFSVTPRFMVANENHSHLIMFMYNNMALDDKNKKTASQTETNTTILNLTYSLGFIPEKLNITVSLNSTKLKNNLYQNTMSGVTAGINKMLASDKITLSWNNSFMINKINADSGTVINTTFTAGFHISKKQSINLSIYYTSNKFPNSLTTPSYNEYRGDFSYVYSF
jgi:hypothetical protein